MITKDDQPEKPPLESYEDGQRRREEERKRQADELQRVRDHMRERARKIGYPFRW